MKKTLIALLVSLFCFVSVSAYAGHHTSHKTRTSHHTRVAKMHKRGYQCKTYYQFFRKYKKCCKRVLVKNGGAKTCRKIRRCSVRHGRRYCDYTIRCFNKDGWARKCKVKRMS